MPSVLVVDDDPRAASTSAALLRHSGFEVRTALSGPQALDDVCERPADVVVLGLDVDPSLLSAIERSGARVVLYGPAGAPADGATVVVSRAEGPVGLLNAITRLT
jgi:CheY-like chemotaxis protein